MKNKLLLLVCLMLACIGQVRADDVDCTDKVDLTWQNASETGTWAAPAVQVSGQSNAINMRENYQDNGTDRMGELISQTIQNLDNGLYKVELYANACYANNVGGTVPTAGDYSIAYVFANDNKVCIPAQVVSTLSSNGEYTIPVYVTDGTLKIGLGKSKAGTNWNTIQIKSLVKVDNTPINVTSYIINPNAVNTTNAHILEANIEGWTATGTNKEFKVNVGTGFDGQKGFFEPSAWGQNSFDMAISQTINGLPNGVYSVRAAGQAAVGCTMTMNIGGKAVSYAAHGASNGTIAADGSTVVAGSGVAGWDWFQTEKHYVGNGTLTITVNTKASQKQIWANVDNFELYYYGMPEDGFDMTDLIVNAGCDKGNGAWSGNDFTYDNKNVAYSNAEHFNKTFDTYQTITGLPNGLYKFQAQGFFRGNANTPAYIYANEGSVKVCTKESGDLEAIKAATDLTALPNSMADCKKAFEAGFYDNNEVYAFVADGTLKIGVKHPSNSTNDWAIFDNFRLTYLGETPAAMDMTGYIVNSEMAGNANGWTTTKNGGNGPMKPSNDAMEYWIATAANGSFDYYQTINGLPNGKYTISAKMYNDKDNQSADPNGNCGLYGSAVSGDVFIGVTEGGQTLKEYTTGEIIVLDGTLRIGVKNKGTISARWFVADDFKLTYAGGLTDQDYIDGAKYFGDNQTELLAKPMYSVTKTALQTAANTASSATDKAAAIAAIDPLTTAITAAETSVADYVNLKKVLDNEAKPYTAVKPDNDYAAKLVEIETGHDNGTYETCTETINTLYGYKVADYNWVKETYTVENSAITGLSGAPGTLTEQSYDGGTKPYYDQNTNGNISMTQTITLDKGDYVLVGIGRGSASGTRSVALTYQPTGSEKTSVNFLMKGDTGLGVDTKGDASFSSTGTYANSNKGRGWEYRFIPFTVENDGTEITIGIDANLDGSWVSFYQPYILMTEETANASTVQAKGDLLAAITAATNKVPTVNIGTGAFQIAQSSIDEFNGWIADAQAVYDDAEATKANYLDAIATLNAKEIGYEYAELNAPAAETRYTMSNNKGALTYTVNAGNSQGGYDLNFAAANVNYAQSVQFNKVAEKLNTYTLSFTDAAGTTHYICNGVPYNASTSTSGIRVTTNINDALEVQVLATSTEGKHNLMNTSIAGGYKKLGAENDGGLYTTDTNSGWSLAAVEKANVTLAVSDVHWATFIAPFNVDITEEGLEAYTVTVKDDEVVAIDLEDKDVIPANTPVLLYMDTNDTYKKVVSNYGLATKQYYTTGNLVGNIDVATIIPATDDKTDYLLQKNDGVVGFYKVEEHGTLKVGKNRAYMQVDTPAVDESRTSFTLEGDETAISAIEALTSGKAEIYDLNGRKLNKLQKGINIVNGTKILVK